MAFALAGSRKRGFLLPYEPAEPVRHPSWVGRGGLLDTPRAFCSLTNRQGRFAAPPWAGRGFC